MRFISIPGYLILICLVFFSCKDRAVTGQITVKSDTLRTRVLSAEEQANLTPDQVTQLLLEGNKRFLMNNLTTRDHSSMVRNARTGQHPMAFVLSCVDSRVPVEDVFDLGIGDLFIGRVAGNIVNADMLGSIEYACKVSGAKLVVVMGHRHCGAIKSAIDGVEMGNITALLANIKPAIKLAADFKGDKSAKNSDYIVEVSKKNIAHTIEEIRKRSPVLKQMEDRGEIKIVPAGYDLEDGRVIIL